MRTLTCMAIAFTLLGCATAPPRSASTTGRGAEAADATPVHSPVDDDGIVGTLVVPDAGRGRPGVLLIGGAEGGIASLRDADTIASEGYAVLAIAYFGTTGLPADLEELPLEYFGKAIAWMKSNPAIDPQRLAIVGISRGSTLALLLPTIYDDFDAVIALAPSHVIWQSSYLDWDRYADRSSFTYGGRPWPYVPYDFSNEAATAACNSETSACALMYEYSLNQSERVRDALIPVEQIRAPILLLSGRADTMWPSSMMGELVMRRLDRTGFSYEHRHVMYDDAGHCGINGCYDSVRLPGNPAAIQGMRREVIEFLGRHLKPRHDSP